ncbi:MAG: hypothetical protein H7Z72_16900 [Bacteroidetes bacterium]|nr:hypothetical protein [Fibrella sp.]
MKSYLIVLLMSVAVNRCADSTSEEPTAKMIIRSGTSYGFCSGYCEQLLSVEGNAVTFTKLNSRAPTLPPITCRGVLTEAKWTDLRAQADLSQLQKQPKTLGCPDCADGGAEFLEIQQGGEQYRVTFEAGTTVPGFEALVTALREKRKAFADCQ